MLSPTAMRLSVGIISWLKGLSLRTLSAASLGDIVPSSGTRAATSSVVVPMEVAATANVTLGAKRWVVTRRVRRRVLSLVLILVLAS